MRRSADRCRRSDRISRLRRGRTTTCARTAGPDPENPGTRPIVSYLVAPSGVWIVNHVVTPMASGRLASARTHAERHLGSSQSSALIQRKNLPRADSSTRRMFS